VSRRPGSVAGDPGHTMVTDRQIRLLRRKLEEGKTIQAAAVAADISERSAHRWKAGGLPSTAKKKPRTWRTRQDPFAEVWEGEIVPLLRADEACVLQAIELVRVLRERHGESYHEGQVRTLQRRISEWRALHGTGKEVFFEQAHVPGREAAIDFTNCSELGITIAGQLFVHLLFELILSFSKWRWVCLAFTETFEALVYGIQGSLWSLGGVPRVIRSDNLSAATRQLSGGGRELNRRFAGVLEHYGLQSTRIEPGESHQNGVVEKAHDTLKSKIEQALVIRGSRDFDSPEQYEVFVLDVVAQLNTRCSDRLTQERVCLQPLPSSRVPDYTTYRAMVRSWSTIHFANRTYSVPSRLIGREVEVRQYADKIEVLYHDKVTEVMPRLRGDQWYRIDYRHVIWSLVRKPGAFTRYRYREELFPSFVFRQAYDTLVKARGERADVEYVRILHLAASTFEADVEAALAVLLEQGIRLDYMAVKALVAPQKTEVPVVHIPPPDLATYDQLLAYAGGER
jgi:hypothetical protein